ncbi:flagellar assembly protein A [Salipaludibacillus sp. HK11]|uniref:flagellar assembly protein A n=1 Tax=Salipaludibacillus sp. HK11 TaxID=3394320 RepID=UPI0039FC6AD5
MTESLIFQGKNVDSAIEKALHQLKLEKKDVHIEIVDPGSERLFGLNRSKAKIIVSKIDNSTTSDQNDSGWEDWLKKEIQDHHSSPSQATPLSDLSNQNLQGKAWVKDGSLYFQDTETKKPLLEVPPDFTVLKNSEPVKGRTYLTNGDLLKFDLETKAIETKWSVKVDQQHQEVTLAVEPGYYIIPSIEDHPPTDVIKIQVAQATQVNNQLTEKDVYDQLEKMKITENIQHDRIKSACQSSEPESYIIAEGMLPKDGSNGEVSYSIDIHERTTPFSEKIDGSIDFRESIYIPSIEEGEMLATIMDPTPGEDGINVYGESLKAKSGEPVILKMGSGIEYLPEENKIIAITKGRPKVEQIGQLVRVSILPKLLHRGDLNMEDGNIHFVGDVEITGHVNEQMTVDAEGSAWMHRNVFHSSIQTRNSITIVGNSINSSLIAGKNSLVFEEIAKKLEPFIHIFEPFVTVLKQLTQSAKFQDTYQSQQGLTPVIKVLAETKFKDLKPTTTQLVKAINERQDLLDRSWHTFAIKLYKSFLVNNHNVIKSNSDVDDLINEAHSLMEICQSPIENNSSITLNYSMNSEIHCNGDVYIQGKGCVNTFIHSDGSVTIKGKTMGGRIHGKEGVTIEQAGSASGVKTFIEVPYDQQIKIKEVMADTVIKVGDKQYVFKKDYFDIRAHLDENENLVFY